MKTFSVLLALCEGNPAVTCLMCTWTNDWAKGRDTGDLIRLSAHCDITVMRISVANFIFMMYQTKLMHKSSSLNERGPNDPDSTYSISWYRLCRIVQFLSRMRMDSTTGIKWWWWWWCWVVVVVVAGGWVGGAGVGLIAVNTPLYFLWEN